MDRIRCIVPFCEKSRAGNPVGRWWCCADHWRERPKEWERLRKRAENEGHAALATFTRKVQSAIIERAAGIG